MVPQVQKMYKINASNAKRCGLVHSLNVDLGHKTPVLNTERRRTWNMCGRKKIYKNAPSNVYTARQNAPSNI